MRIINGNELKKLNMAKKMNVYMKALQKQEKAVQVVLSTMAKHTRKLRPNRYGNL